MVWQVIFTKKAQEQISELDKPIQSRLKKIHHGEIND